jgi:hypothetical protein
MPRGQRDGSLQPYSRFSRQDLLLFYQVAPQLYSRGWVDPVTESLLFFSLVMHELDFLKLFRWNSCFKRLRVPQCCSSARSKMTENGGRENFPRSLLRALVFRSLSSELRFSATGSVSRSDAKCVRMRRWAAVPTSFHAVQHNTWLLPGSTSMSISFCL